MRLGLFGGSFDPVHNGHLRLADCCREQAALDEVWFVPTAVQPHKPSGPLASDADRLAMLELALADRPAMRVCDLEIRRGGLSYTVETLAEVHADRPEAELFFLMGADALSDLPNWRDPGRVLGLTTPLVVHRADQPPPDFTPLAAYVDGRRLGEIAESQVEMPPLAVSSTELRERLARGDRCGDDLPAAVADYAIERGAYS